MDIGFTEEQELLRDTARKFLDGECPTTFVRQMMASEAAVTPEFWQKLAEQGWLGITYAEEDGGSGLGRRRDHPRRARDARRVHALGHQALRPRRSSRRCAGGRGALARRQHDG